jgi:hypothetical protein
MFTETFRAANGELVVRGNSSGVSYLACYTKSRGLLEEGKEETQNRTLERGSQVRECYPLSREAYQEMVAEVEATNLMSEPNPNESPIHVTEHRLHRLKVDLSKVTDPMSKGAHVAGRWVGSAWKGTTHLAARAGNKVKDVARSTSPHVKDGVKKSVDWTRNVAGSAAGKVAKAATKVKDVARDTSPKIKDGVKRGYGWTKDVAGNATGKVKNVVRETPRFVARLPTNIGGGYSWTKNNFLKGWDSAKNLTASLSQTGLNRLKHEDAKNVKDSVEKAGVNLLLGETLQDDTNICKKVGSPPKKESEYVRKDDLPGNKANPHKQAPQKGAAWKMDAPPESASATQGTDDFPDIEVDDIQPDKKGKAWAKRTMNWHMCTTAADMYKAAYECDFSHIKVQGETRFTKVVGDQSNFSIPRSDTHSYFTTTYPTLCAPIAYAAGQMPNRMATICMLNEGQPQGQAIDMEIAHFLCEFTSDSTMRAIFKNLDHNGRYRASATNPPWLHVGTGRYAGHAFWRCKPNTVDKDRPAPAKKGDITNECFAYALPEPQSKTATAQMNAGRVTQKRINFGQSDENTTDYDIMDWVNENGYQVNVYRLCNRATRIGNRLISPCHLETFMPLFKDVTQTFSMFWRHHEGHGGAFFQDTRLLTEINEARHPYVIFRTGQGILFSVGRNNGNMTPNAQWINEMYGYFEMHVRPAGEGILPSTNCEELHTLFTKSNAPKLPIVEPKYSWYWIPRGDLKGVNLVKDLEMTTDSSKIPPHGDIRVRYDTVMDNFRSERSTVYRDLNTIPLICLYLGLQLQGQPKVKEHTPKPRTGQPQDNPEGLQLPEETNKVSLVDEKCKGMLDKPFFFEGVKVTWTDKATNFDRGTMNYSQGFKFQGKPEWLERMGFEVPDGTATYDHPLLRYIANFCQLFGMAKYSAVARGGREAEGMIEAMYPSDLPKADPRKYVGLKELNYLSEGLQPYVKPEGPSYAIKPDQPLDLEDIPPFTNEVIIAPKAVPPRLVIVDIGAKVYPMLRMLPRGSIYYAIMPALGLADKARDFKHPIEDLHELANKMGIELHISQEKACRELATRFPEQDVSVSMVLLLDSAYYLETCDYAAEIMRRHTEAIGVVSFMQYDSSSKYTRGANKTNKNVHMALRSNQVNSYDLGEGFWQIGQAKYLNTHQLCILSTPRKNASNYFHPTFGVGTGKKVFIHRDLLVMPDISISTGPGSAYAVGRFSYCVGENEIAPNCEPAAVDRAQKLLYEYGPLKYSQTSITTLRTYLHQRNMRIDVGLGQAMTHVFNSHAQESWLIWLQSSIYKESIGDAQERSLVAVAAPDYLDNKGEGLYDLEMYDRHFTAQSLGNLRDGVRYVYAATSECPFQYSHRIDKDWVTSRYSKVMDYNGTEVEVGFEVPEEKRWVTRESRVDASTLFTARLKDGFKQPHVEGANAAVPIGWKVDPWGARARAPKDHHWYQVKRVKGGTYIFKRKTYSPWWYSAYPAMAALAFTTSIAAASNVMPTDTLAKKIAKPLVRVACMGGLVALIASATTAALRSAHRQGFIPYDKDLTKYIKPIPKTLTLGAMMCCGAISIFKPKVGLYCMLASGAIALASAVGRRTIVAENLINTPLFGQERLIGGIEPTQGYNVQDTRLVPRELMHHQWVGMDVPNERAGKVRYFKKTALQRVEEVPNFNEFKDSLTSLREFTSEEFTQTYKESGTKPEHLDVLRVNSKNTAYGLMGRHFAPKTTPCPNTLKKFKTWYDKELEKITQEHPVKLRQSTVDEFLAECETPKRRIYEQAIRKRERGFLGREIIQFFMKRGEKGYDKGRPRTVIALDPIITIQTAPVARKLAEVMQQLLPAAINKDFDGLADVAEKEWEGMNPEEYVDILLDGAGWDSNQSIELKRIVDDAFIHLFFDPAFNASGVPQHWYRDAKRYLAQHVWRFKALFPGTRKPMVLGWLIGTTVSGQATTTLGNTLRQYFVMRYCLRDLRGKAVVAGDDAVIRLHRDDVAKFTSNYHEVHTTTPEKKEAYGLGLATKGIQMNDRCTPFRTVPFLSKLLTVIPGNSRLARQQWRIHGADFIESSKLSLAFTRERAAAAVTYGMLYMLNDPTLSCLYTRRAEFTGPGNEADWKRIEEKYMFKATGGKRDHMHLEAAYRAMELTETGMVLANLPLHTQTLDALSARVHYESRTLKTLKQVSAQ